MEKERKEQEIILEIKGKLKLSYDKDESEAHLQVLYMDYPLNTYGSIESKFISISFQGKFFLCDYVYIKAHNKKDRKESIYFLGYIGNRAIFSQSYTDNKKRNEKWLKLGLQTTFPINLLVISGPYDIDNFSFIAVVVLNGALHTKASGLIPRFLKSLTLFCVGLVFNSLEPYIYMVLKYNVQRKYHFVLFHIESV